MQKCDVKSSQLAQQDAELAAVKQEVASRLAAHQELERVTPALYLPFALQGSWSVLATESCLLGLVKVGNGALVK